MLNYLSGELYKISRHKSLYIGVGLLLILECIVFSPQAWVQEDMAFRQEVLLAFFNIALFIGLFIAPIFAVLAFDNQHGNATMKNEIVYGIPRSRIYFGKMMAGWIVGTMAALLVVAVYLARALSLSTYLGNTESVLMGTFASFIGHWMTWLSIYSFTFFLLMLFRGTVGAVAMVYVTTAIGFPVSMLGFSPGEMAPWLRTACQFFYTSPLNYVLEGSLVLGVTIDGEPLNGLPVVELAGMLVGSHFPYMLGVCLLWTVGLSLLGLAIFSRREIK